MKAIWLALVFIFFSFTGRADGVIPSTYAILCLDKKSSTFEDDKKALLGDIEQFGRLRNETKTRLLPRVKDVSVEDYFYLRNQMESQTDAEIKRRYGHLQSEFERPGSAKDKLDQIEGRFRRALPLFAQVYEWAGGLVGFELPNFAKAVPPRKAQLLLGPYYDACVTVPISFVLLDPFALQSATAFRIAIDPDLYAALASPIQQAMLLNRERLSLISIHTKTIDYEKLAVINPPLFGDYFWLPWEQNSSPNYELSKGLQNTLYSSGLPYYETLQIFSGRIDVRKHTAPSAFTRMISWAELKTAQNKIFRDEFSKSDRSYMKFFEARSRAESPELQDIDNPESAFMYLAEIRLDYSARRGEKAISLIGHSRQHVAIESLMSLREKEDSAFEARQNAYLIEYCHSIEAAAKKVSLDAGLKDASLADKAKVKIFELALDYCRRLKHQ